MDTTLRASVLASVEAAGDAIGEKDRGAVDLALKYADAIDAAAEVGGQDLTKALYLGPHLLKALVELGLTPVKLPGARDAEETTPEQVVSDELSALRSRHRGGA